MKKFIWLVLFLLLIVAVTPVFAMGHAQDANPPATAPAAPGAEFVALLVTITAFFKTQLKTSAYGTLGLAFVVGLILFLTPLIATTWPGVSPWVLQVVEFIKLFLAAVGVTPLITNLGQKIAGN